MKTEQESPLSKKIMRRVYVIHALRVFKTEKAVCLTAVGLLLAEMSPFFPYISLKNIIANMQNISDWRTFYTFELAAILNTEPIVQISLAAAALAMSVPTYRFLGKTLSRVGFPASLRGAAN